MKSPQVFLSTALCMSVAYANPLAREGTTERRNESPKAVHFLDKFDDHVILPTGAGPTNAVGTYGALKYAAFSIMAATTVPLIPPPSKPNYVYIGPIGEITGGEHQLLPANSTVKYFNLESLAYACAAQASLAPVTCTIQISGKKAPQFGGAEEQVELVFNKATTTGVLVSSYDTFTFPAAQFQGLVSATVNIISAPLTTVVTEGLFDNVKYAAYIQK